MNWLEIFIESEVNRETVKNWGLKELVTAELHALIIHV